MAPSGYRDLAHSLSVILDGEEDLRARYASAKRIVRAFRRPAFYEVATRCNLLCEGCYYFEDADREPVAGEPSLDAWDAFFADEAARGVSMSYYVGAEPALEQERLIVASRHFAYGNVGTNGTIRLDPQVRFRISVSIWAGDDETDARLRGASVFRKALRNYAGDPRAIMLYTVSAWNIDEAAAAARMCADHGVALTFNLYSPTQSFLDKLATAAHDGKYFRVSTVSDSPCLGERELARTREVIDRLIDDYPATVVYSHAYNRWSTEPGPRHAIDPATGVAEQCGSRVVEPLRYHRTDLKPRRMKCCTPSFDCSQCRIYSAGWSSRLMPQPWNLESPSAFGEWLEMIETIGRIFVFDGWAESRSGAGREGAAAA